MRSLTEKTSEPLVRLLLRPGSMSSSFLREDSSPRRVCLCNRQDPCPARSFAVQAHISIRQLRKGSKEGETMHPTMPEKATQPAVITNNSETTPTTLGRVF